MTKNLLSPHDYEHGEKEIQFSFAFVTSSAIFFARFLKARVLEGKRE